MTKDTKTARNDDADIICAVDGHSHRNALLILDGDLGPELAFAARQLVQVFRMAVRARRRSVGDLHPEAFRAVARGYRSDLAEHSFPVGLAATAKLDVLVGVNATFERHTKDISQYLTGVVIGLEWQQAGPALRVALTSPAPARKVGEELVVLVYRWQITPTPEHISATASRATRCAAGRPLYGPDDVPKAVLATRAELALCRLRPATLQPPVASLRRRSGTVDLYARFDAEKIPTPHRNKSAIGQRRTCVRCGFTAAEPLPQADDGKRYCQNHIEAAVRRVVFAVKARDRAVSAVWASEVLANTNAILVGMLGVPDDFRIRVEDVSGNVILEESIAGTPLPPAFRRRMSALPRVELPDWINGDEALALGRRRPIITCSQRGREYYESILANEYPDDLPVAVQLSGGEMSRFVCEHKAGDDLTLRRLIWTGEKNLKGLYERFRPRYELDLSCDEEAQLDLEAVVATTRRDLYEMSSTSLTEDQRDHAVKLLRNRHAPDYQFFRRMLKQPKFSNVSSVMRLFSEAVIE